MPSIRSRTGSAASLSASISATSRRPLSRAPRPPIEAGHTTEIVVSRSPNGRSSKAWWRRIAEDFRSCLLRGFRRNNYTIAGACMCLPQGECGIRNLLARTLRWYSKCRPEKYEDSMRGADYGHRLYLWAACSRPLTSAKRWYSRHFFRKSWCSQRK